jgi:hypothetical protein
MILDFTILKGSYSIYRLKNDSFIPDWIFDSEFFSLTRTKEELSIVCKHVDITMDSNTKVDKHWRILKINGQLDLSIIGVIAYVSSLLKENKIPVFTVSTYDTDYILVKNQHIDKTLKALENNGHKVFIEK